MELKAGKRKEKKFKAVSLSFLPSLPPPHTPEADIYSDISKRHSLPPHSLTREAAIDSDISKRHSLPPHSSLTHP